MKYAKLINNKLEFAPKKIIKDGFIITNPGKELVLSLGFKELRYSDKPELNDPLNNYLKEVYSDKGDYILVEYKEGSFPPVQELPYDEKVNNLIREKYSESNELAIIRQKDTKPAEFKEYYDFCEDCKLKIKMKVLTPII